MRAEPPEPSKRDRPPRSPEKQAPAVQHRRCPYLEQILREKAGPFHLLTRYKADCHVDRRVHKFTGRHPTPPCIGNPDTCSLYRGERGLEDQKIRRYSD
ncbi:MAG: hypothetical protein ACREN2_01655 [Candidatus Dormibacteria bacterium]